MLPSCVALGRVQRERVRANEIQKAAVLRTQQTLTIVTASSSSRLTIVTVVVMVVSVCSCPGCTCTTALPVALIGELRSENNQKSDNHVESLHIVCASMWTPALAGLPPTGRLEHTGRLPKEHSYSTSDSLSPGNARLILNLIGVLAIGHVQDEIFPQPAVLFVELQKQRDAH